MKVISTENGFAFVFENQQSLEQHILGLHKLRKYMKDKKVPYPAVYFNYNENYTPKEVASEILKELHGRFSDSNAIPRILKQPTEEKPDHF